MKLLLYFLVIVSICSCRTKKVQRTIITNDSVVAKKIDSSFLSKLSTLTQTTSAKDYTRNTVIHFNKTVKPVVHIDSVGNISLELPPVDSVDVFEKGNKTVQQQSQVQKTDSGTVSKAQNTAVHSSVKTVNKEVHSSFGWMYAVAFFLILGIVAAYVYAKHKDYI